MTGAEVIAAQEVAMAQQNAGDTSGAKRLAERQAKAIHDWLKSLKETPALFKYDLGSIVELLDIAAAGNPDRTFKLLALQKALDVYYVENDPASTNYQSFRFSLF